MFEPYSDSDFPANAFRYKGVPVRFTYRVDLGVNHVGEMDIDAVLPGEEKETRLHRLRGPWPGREEALESAKAWTASYLDGVLEE
ncbi:hypothetical protein [Stutzerimonas nitrititolerans]|uniref:hypothetical protein n=1 Tax=Stutzerimonas nitrititolerans TaxID=2482751 RepID=UPI0028ACA9E8|nr:hypothetical protein [Stutzerimonas nitrititolerans]